MQLTGRNYNFQPHKRHLKKIFPFLPAFRKQDDGRRGKVSEKKLFLKIISEIESIQADRTETE